MATEELTLVVNDTELEVALMRLNLATTARKRVLQQAGGITGIRDIRSLARQIPTIKDELSKVPVHGCRFYPRCRISDERCLDEGAELLSIKKDHCVRCRKIEVIVNYCSKEQLR